MAYTPTIWKQGNIITEDKLQKIEDELARNGDVKKDLENLIIIQETQPSEKANKIWINPDTDNLISIPTYEEFLHCLYEPTGETHVIRNDKQLKDILEYGIYYCPTKNDIPDDSPTQLTFRLLVIGRRNKNERGGTLQFLIDFNERAWINYYSSTRSEWNGWKEFNFNITSENILSNKKDAWERGSIEDGLILDNETGEEWIPDPPRTQEEQENYEKSKLHGGELIFDNDPENYCRYLRLKDYVPVSPNTIYTIKR